MGKTIAEALREEGHKEGHKEGVLWALQRILLIFMRKRFGSVPRKMTARIKATKNTTQLNTWIDASLTVGSIAEIGIE